jgi:pyruvate-ferredoxin/flavodoxin oxidoreductase
MGAVAKFSVGGKDTEKKDLALIAMQYAGVYVAKVAFGAKDSQTMQAFVEAEAHQGPSLIIAYSHCIAHGYALSQGLDQQKLAVETGYWPIFRNNPARLSQGLPAMVMDSPAPKQPLSAYTRNELRFQVLHKSDPERAAMLAKRAQVAADAKQITYQYLASKGSAVPPTAAVPAAVVAAQPKPEKTP